MIKKIKNRDSKLVIPNLAKADDMKLVIFTDALYAIFQMDI